MPSRQFHYLFHRVTRSSFDFHLPPRDKNQDLVLALSAEDKIPAGWIPIGPWLEDYREPWRPQRDAQLD